MNEDQMALDSFNGITRLFPLPNLVFFPHALQPLHIFEQRYRQMTADALADDRLLSLVLLQPGWEQEYDHRPPIHGVACLGRIVADQLLPDGRYNLLLRGLSRVRILEEIPTDDSYRTARVELLADPGELAIGELMALRKQLAEQLLPRFGEGLIARQMTDLFQSELPLGAVCDVLTFALPLPIECKQALLEQVREVDSCRLLLDGIGSLHPAKEDHPSGVGRKFPPNFSPN